MKVKNKNIDKFQLKNESLLEIVNRTYPNVTKDVTITAAASKATQTVRSMFWNLLLDGLIIVGLGFVLWLNEAAFQASWLCYLSWKLKIVWIDGME